MNSVNYILYIYIYIYIYKLKQKLVHETHSGQHPQSKEHNTYIVRS